LFERNENGKFGVVIYNIYREVKILSIQIGRKRRKKFLSAYAQIASKFALIGDGYGQKIKSAAEQIYQAFVENESWELADDTEALSCAIYQHSGVKNTGRASSIAAPTFNADTEKVERILSMARKK
jgi:hypothetical protein